MKMKLAGTVAAGVVALAGGISPAGAAVALVDFENTPNRPTGPSIYVAVPGPETITTTPATFSGGVVLGFATFFPAIAFATVPNVYGTADFGNGLSKALTIDVNPAFTTTEVSFALFNGETFNQSYTVNAYKGATLVTSQSLANIASNFNSGYALADVISATGITKVTITADGAPPVWDFLIDTVAFNQKITDVIHVPPPPPPNGPPAIPPPPPVQGHIHGHGENETELVEVNFGDDVNDIRGSVRFVTPNTPVPEPSTWAMMVAGLAGFGIAGYRRAKKATTTKA